MTESEHKQYLSDVISYERDIAPYGFIKILAGVGSGKNHFINKLVNGYIEQRADGSEYVVKPQSVLCITSRRAKVNELKEDESISVGTYVREWDNGCAVEDLDEYFRSRREVPDLDGWGEGDVHQRSIACTNAAIEAYLKASHSANNAETHLWHRFDIIVVDEVHSLFSDASYQSAPFYVRKLIRESIERYEAGTSACKVIIMTGSPRIISRIPMPKGGHTIDVMEKCRNVTPKRISFVDSIEARKDMLRRLEFGEKAIYFSNHITTILEMYDGVKGDLRQYVAASFSDLGKLDISKQTHVEIAEKMKRLQEELATVQKLPEDVRLFLTTSKNKEGINIRNTDVKTMYIESHAEVDIIQMVGRVRDGIDDLFIVTNATGFGGNDNGYEFSFTRTEKIAESATDYFNIVCSKNKIVIDPNSEHYTYKPVYSYPKIKEYIDYIHVKFPYLRFNFFNNSFELYTERRTSERYYWEQNVAFQKAKEDPGRLEVLARRWFPDVEVVWGESRQEQLDNYLQSKGLIGRLLSKEELEAERSEVARIIGCAFSSWGPKLRQFGYELKDASKNTKAKTYGKKMIVKIDGVDS